MLSPGLWPSFSSSGPVKDGPSIIYTARIQAERVWAKRAEAESDGDTREFEEGGDGGVGRSGWKKVKTDIQRNKHAHKKGRERHTAKTHRGADEVVAAVLITPGGRERSI